jgi:hypothetical protein
MSVMCEGIGLAPECSETRPDALDEGHIMEMLAQEFGATLSKTELAVAMRAARAASRTLAAKLAHHAEILDSVVERAAGICESYYECDTSDEAEEFNQALVVRAEQIRKLTNAAAASMQDPEEFVLTAPHSKLTVPDTWKIRLLKSGEFSVEKAGIGGCTLGHETIDGNTEAFIFQNYIRDQMEALNATGRRDI